jgi:hypothetical protein
MPARKSAASVSMTALARTIDTAVQRAATRHELAVDKDTLLDRWEIIGRRLRDVADIDIAYKFAQEVSANVKLPGVKIQPVVARIGRDTLVGFIERAGMPRVINR